jgi:hypothetical protein
MKYKADGFKGLSEFVFWHNVIVLLISDWAMIIKRIYTKDEGCASNGR